MTRGIGTYDADAALFRAGTHVLAASAGTGKTHAIKKLVARYICETDIRIDQMLIMTFSRSATQELRDRVRTELREQLRGATGGTRDKLEHAVSNLDSASISTTHEFCTSAFAGLGVRADRDPGEALTEDLTDLRLDAAADVYLSMFRTDPPQRLTPSAAEGIAKAVVEDPISTVLHQEPGAGEATGSPSAEDPAVVGDAEHAEQQRIDFADRVRAAVRESQHREHLVSYDDLVLRLRDALRDPRTGTDVAQRLRDRYRVVLVDEFQDTDPAQWEIIQQAFHGHAVVLLIGDPKQGIYAFRGADIHSYLAAARVSTSEQTLPMNYRSDAAVVAGISELLQFGDPPVGIELGDPAIDVHPIAAHIAGPRLTGGGLDERRRVRMRIIDAGPANVGARRQGVARDVASDVRALLDSEPLLAFDVEDGAPPAADPRPLSAGDIAIIVRTNAQARRVREALRVVGVPAVINSTESVFASPACFSLLALLRAMEDPGPDQLRRALLCGLFEQTPDDLVRDPDEALRAASVRVRQYGDALARGGVAALIAALLSDRTLLQQSLRREDGERFVTDLRHLSALLHEEERTRRRGLTGLVDWLSDEFDEAGGSGSESSESLTRRLESDADAVQVITIHRSKGLQYPVTYVPFGWDRPRGRPSEAVRFTSPSDGRLIDVRSRQPGGHRASAELAQAEEAGEDLRMLYVALTRASSLVVVTALLGKEKGTSMAPLDRVLFARHAGQPAPEREYSGRLPDLSFHHIAVEGPIPLPTADPVPVAAVGPTQSDDEAVSTLAAAPYDRTDIDSAWNRSSFTGLTKGAPHGAPREAEEDTSQEKTDETNAEQPQEAEAPAVPPAATTGLDGPSPFAGLPSGTAFGSLVHAVLEHVDPQSADLPAELAMRCAEQLTERPVAGLTAEALARALQPVLATPLGHLAPSASLASIPTSDRLPELDFEMPLQQGRDAGQTVAAIGALLARQGGEPPWVRAYGEQLRVSPFAWKQLRGYLIGSIDAVLRIDGRFSVVDYKTNLLGAADGTLRDYRTEVLPAAMMQAHYPLQALLYSVALHRFLQHRLTGYDPEAHLGGILYLFVRGMAGPHTPTDAHGDPCGVFAWRPAGSLVTALSGLLGGERP